MQTRRPNMLVAVLLAHLATSAHAQAPQFFFWGNFYEAYSFLDYDRGIELEPVALTDADMLARCRAKPNEPLVLVRNGVVAGAGRVREIRAGVVPRAGGDRIMYLLPEALPDSVIVPPEPPYPGRDDAGFDLYVVGADSVAVVDAGPGRPLVEDEIARLLAGAVEAEVLNPRYFGNDMTGQWVEPPQMPPLSDAAAWLRTTTHPVVFELSLHGAVVAVEWCRPYFLRVCPADMADPVYLRGSLDYFLTVDGECYLIMRDGQPGTGMWGYFVYRLTPYYAPERVYADTSWST